MSLPINLSEEQLQAVEEMAAHGFQLEEIAEVLLLPTFDMQLEFKNKESLLYLHFRKGYLQSELELRQRIFKDAKNGSSPAQTLAKKIMDDGAYKAAQQ